MTTAAIVTGSNEGDAAANLQRAAELLERRAGRIVRRSGLYRSAAWGFESADFLNQALEIETELPPMELLETVLECEREAGRDRRAEKLEKERTGQRYARRTVDIDIILYGDEVIDELRLTVPHPRMAERRFVLEPLVEIMPSRVCPATGLTLRQMLENID